MPPILNDVKARPGLPYGFPVITRLSWALEKQRRRGRGERESGELLIRGNAAVGGWGQD